MPVKYPNWFIGEAIIVRKIKNRVPSAGDRPPWFTIGLPPSRFLMMASVFFGVFSGCSVTSEFPADKLPDRSAQIIPARTDIAATHKTLGDPLIASRYWGFELYRDTASQTEMPMALVIPVGRIKDDIHRYTLVSFDADRLVQSVVSGLHRYPSAFRIASPISYDHLTLSLRAGQIACIREWEDRRLTLLAAPALRDDYLDLARSSPQATLVIGCGTHECSDQLSIDGESGLPLPCRLQVTDYDSEAFELLRRGEDQEFKRRYPTVRYDTVAAIRLPPGRHTLKASGGRWSRDRLGGFLPGEQTAAVSCRAGEILYVVIDVSVGEYSWWGAKDVRWNMDIHTDMPDFFRNRSLVLYRGDRWLADPEPEKNPGIQ